MIATCWLGMLGLAQAKDWSVPGDFATVQAAVTAAATTGDRVLIGPGEFTGDVAVSYKDIALVGAGPGLTVLKGSGGTSVVTLTGGVVGFEGLSVQGEGLRRGLATSYTAVTLVDVELLDGGPANGGAALITGGSHDWTRVWVDGNRSSEFGGGVHGSYANITIRQSRFTDNAAQTYVYAEGGAVYTLGGVLRISDSEFEGNSALPWAGGAVFATYTDVRIERSRFVDNPAPYGMIYCYLASPCVIVDSWFEGQRGADLGGAIDVYGAGTTEIGRNVFCDNQTQEVDGVDDRAPHALVMASTGTVHHNLFVAGRAHNQAGAVALWGGGTVQVTQNTFGQNVAGGSGGALWIDQTTTGVRNNLFVGNTSTDRAVVTTSGVTTRSYNGYFGNTGDGGLALQTGELVGTSAGVVDPDAGGCDPSAWALSVGSPFIDVGDPAVLDADGTRSDLGAFGGPNPNRHRDEDGDGSVELFDCDDQDPDRTPGAVEVVADGVDQDCDNTELCYVDLDFDGFGGAEVVESANMACSKPGISAVGGDCDDLEGSAPVIYPGAVEGPADGVDQDCDGFEACYEDQDGDGWGSDGVVLRASLDCDEDGVSDQLGDCDDADGAVNPETIWYEDNDGDGVGGEVALTAQCEAVPGGSVESDDCDDEDADVGPPTSWRFDEDGDGYGAGDETVSCEWPGYDWITTSGDCAPLDPNINPETVWYLDNDGDYFGQVSTIACDPPGENWSPEGGDCDDFNID